MEIPVLIQAVPGKGFVARAGSPFDWTAEGSTEAEALAKLQSEAIRYMSAGASAVALTVPNGTSVTGLMPKASATTTVINPPVPGENPWMRFAGLLKRKG